METTIAVMRAGREMPCEGWVGGLEVCAAAEDMVATFTGPADDVGLFDAEDVVNFEDIVVGGEDWVAVREAGRL